MNPGDIQTFLNSKLSVCDTNGSQQHWSGQSRASYGSSVGYPPPYTCLKDYVQTIPGMVPDAFCSGTVFSGTKTAAQIIYDVAQACGVSPKVILVLLQKEQGLITDSWPWSVQYTKATGMGCPDSALGTDVDANQNGCYDEYEGFFKQVYYAARQFQRYAKQPGSFIYRGGLTSFVQYNPNSGCGGLKNFLLKPNTTGGGEQTPY